jgi:RimJ/RimL family protein N-acetyltransferase
MNPLELHSLRLETPRLVLRPPRLEDFDAWAAFQTDEIATKYVGGVQPRAIAWRSFMCMCGAWSMTGVAMFSVIEKATGAWVGRLGPWNPEGWPEPEVGWGIVREHWGKGYASEGAAAAMDYAFEVLGWQRVIHCIDRGNEASKGVARKLGSRFLYVAKMPAPYEAVAMEAWGQERGEWMSKR